jgi:hypothetical protein
MGKARRGAARTRQFDKRTVDRVRFGAGIVTRASFEPGWRWSECVKQIVGGDCCQRDHFGYCVSGRLHIRMLGEELEIGPGDVVRIPRGHDGGTVALSDYPVRLPPLRRSMTTDHRHSRVVRAFLGALA